MAKKLKDLQYYEGVGRRREAVARVRLYIVSKGKDVTIKGTKINKGQVVINGKPMEEVVLHDYDKQRILKPLRLTNSDDRFAISIKTTGGGPNGQIEAISHGLARSLCLADSDAYRPVLKQEGLLTRDPRTRQRRMVGKGGKARRANNHA